MKHRWSLALLLAALAVFSVGLAPSLVNSAPEDPLLVTAAESRDVSVVAPYQQLRSAIAAGDAAELQRLSAAGDSYLAYSASLALSALDDLPAAQRLEALERALELRIHDSLKRAENLELLLMKASLAEAAGALDKALVAYRDALPDERAVAAYMRLEADPYRRAAGLQNAGKHMRALEALGDLTAPSVEATSLRALGRYEEALAAYRRWLVEEPGNSTALSGEAWCLFYLGRDDEATAAFTALGPSGHYGLGLLANRAGQLDLAVEHLARTGRADLLWLATGLYEAKDRYADSLPLYMRLARGTSSYADDAAFRAYVLASRLGDEATAVAARELIPFGNFFAIILGGEAAAPDPFSAEPGPYSLAAMSGEPPSKMAAEALLVARELSAAGEHDAAVGESLFALRRAEAGGDVATVLDLAELLQSLDEYRQSTRAGRELLSAGIDDLRAWRLAYPPAYPLTVIPEAAENEIEPALIWAVMRQESAFSPVAVSRSNALGLMQVIPSTWDWIAEMRREQPANPFEVSSNIAYGATYLAWLLNYFDGDEELVIAGYNGGQGYVRRIFESAWVAEDKHEFYREIDQPETREYLQRVYENMAVYRLLYPGLAHGELDWEEARTAGLAAGALPNR